MADIFQEVDEEVRRERLAQLWKRYGNVIVAACILVVLGVGAWRGYEWWQNKRAGESGVAFENAVLLAQAGKHEEAEAAFAKLAADGAGGYRTLSRLRQAAELEPTDKKAAIAAYDALANDTGVDQVVRQLAAVRAGYLLVDTASYPEMRTRLEPLTAADKIYRHSARELLALSAWKAGDANAVKQWTAMIINDPRSPDGTRSRAAVLSELVAAGDKG